MNARLRPVSRAARHAHADSKLLDLQRATATKRLDKLEHDAGVHEQAIWLDAPENQELAREYDCLNRMEWLRAGFTGVAVTAVTHVRLRERRSGCQRPASSRRRATSRDDGSGGSSDGPGPAGLEVLRRALGAGR